MNFSFNLVDDTDIFKASIVKRRGPKATSFGTTRQLEGGKTILDNVEDSSAALALYFPTVMARLDNQDTLTRLHLLKGLGEGTMGRVFLARDESTSKVFALKVFNKCHVFACEEQEHTAAERDILAEMCDNPFIVHLRASFQDEIRLYMLLDFCAGGDLATQLRRWPSGMPMESVAFNAAHLVEGIDSLHALGIIHRDLKPHNILFTVRGHIKISDFGSAIRVPSPESWIEPDTEFGTAAYIPPELYLGYHNHSIDWWALGVIFYEMVFGKHPFLTPEGPDHVDFDDLTDAVCNGEYTLPPTLDYATRRIIRGLLRINPERRWGAHQARNSDFFAGWDWDLVKQLRYQPPTPHVIPSHDATFNFDREHLDMNLEDDENITSNDSAEDLSVFAGFERFDSAVEPANVLQRKLLCSSKSSPLSLHEDLASLSMSNATLLSRHNSDFNAGSR